MLFFLLELALSPALSSLRTREWVSISSVIKVKGGGESEENRSGPTERR